jgi:hypothetical protein
VDLRPEGPDDVINPGGGSNGGGTSSGAREPFGAQPSLMFRRSGQRWAADRGGARARRYQEVGPGPSATTDDSGSPPAGARLRATARRGRGPRRCLCRCCGP